MPGVLWGCLRFYRDVPVGESQTRRLKVGKRWQNGVEVRQVAILCYFRASSQARNKHHEGEVHAAILTAGKLNVNHSCSCKKSGHLTSSNGRLPHSLTYIYIYIILFHKWIDLKPDKPALVVHLAYSSPAAPGLHPRRLVRPAGEQDRTGRHGAGSESWHRATKTPGGNQ